MWLDPATGDHRLTDRHVRSGRGVGPRPGNFRLSTSTAVGELQHCHWPFRFSRPALWSATPIPTSRSRPGSDTPILNELFYDLLLLICRSFRSARWCCCWPRRPPLGPTAKLGAGRLAGRRLAFACGRHLPVGRVDSEYRPEIRNRVPAFGLMALLVFPRVRDRVPVSRDRRWPKSSLRQVGPMRCSKLIALQGLGEAVALPTCGDRGWLPLTCSLCYWYGSVANPRCAHLARPRTLPGGMAAATGMTTAIPLAGSGWFRGWLVPGSWRCRNAQSRCWQPGPRRSGPGMVVLRGVADTDCLHDTGRPMPAAAWRWPTVRRSLVTAGSVSRSGCCDARQSRLAGRCWLASRTDGHPSRWGCC